MAFRISFFVSSIIMSETERKELDEFCKNYDKMAKLIRKGKKPNRGAFGHPIYGKGFAKM